VSYAAVGLKPPHEGNLLRDQPGCGAIKQSAGSLSASPAERVQPTVETKLGSRIAEIAKPTMPAYLRGAVPAGFAVAVMKKATKLLDLELEIRPGTWVFQPPVRVV